MMDQAITRATGATPSTKPSTTPSTTPPTGVTPRSWAILLTSANHGTVGPLGSTFSHAGEHHERVVVVEVPAGAGAPSDEVNLVLRAAPAAEASASTVLTDERIYKIAEGNWDTIAFARAIEREVAAQAGQVAVPEAWGLYAEVDGVMVLQYPVRFSKSECEADARIYVDGTKIEIRPMVSFSPAKESK